MKKGKKGQGYQKKKFVVLVRSTSPILRILLLLGRTYCTITKESTDLVSSSWSALPQEEEERGKIKLLKGREEDDDERQRQETGMTEMTGMTEEQQNGRIGMDENEGNEEVNTEGKSGRIQDEAAEEDHGGDDQEKTIGGEDRK